MKRRPVPSGLRPAFRVLALAGAACAALGMWAADARAQQVFVDRGVRAADLWCFPLTTDSLTYVYLPAGVRLAEDEQGQPQFSFVRYVINTGGDTTSAASITEARGGGVLTFLVQLDTPAAMVRDAAAALQKTLDQPGVTLRGPMIFTDGRFTLVSSVLQPGANRAETHAIAAGRAPVLEGNRLALSFDLDPSRASLLLKSFAMATPDVSLMFDMTFSGLTEAYNADMTVHWSEVRKSKAFSAGGSAYFVSADISVALDELRRSNAIELRTAGNDPVTEGLVQTVYGKLLELMFRPVEPERAPAGGGNVLDALGRLAGGRGIGSARTLFGFGAHVGYQLRDLRTEGTSVMTFNHRGSVERHSLLAFNLGDLERTHGSDPRFFRAVNLGDPAFQQREIQVAVDGALLPELESVINSITVTLRKTHANGEVTLRELVLDRRNTIQGVLADRMVYGWNGDHDRVAWLGYEYRTRWSFRGGGVHETDWTRSESPMIDLFAPYERRRIELAGDPEFLRTHGVRAVVVQIEHPFFNEMRRPQLVVRPDEAFEEKHVVITLPIGQPTYDVTLTWQMSGGGRRTAKTRESSGLVFVDELPPPD